MDVMLTPTQVLGMGLSSPITQQCSAKPFNVIIFCFKYEKTNVLHFHNHQEQHSHVRHRGLGMKTPELRKNDFTNLCKEELEVPQPGVHVI